MTHDRTVNLRVEPGLVLRGKVRAGGFEPCESDVLVKIVRNGKVVARLTTRSNGRFRVRLDDLAGRYVAKAPEAAPDTSNACERARSKTRKV